MKYYFIGISGVSMSALAVLLKSKGNYVSGSDLNLNCKILQKNNIKIFYQENVKEMSMADIVIVSSAIKSDNLDLINAKIMHKKIITRGELLGKIANSYEKVIAISGSHGKTTTTALIYNILKNAGEKPTLHLGGELCEEKSNVVIGDSKYFVTEACEYCDNFLYLYPYIGVVTNIEKEHMDYFKTFENEKKSFEKFKKQCKIVVDEDRKFCAKNIRYDKNGKLCFNIFYNYKKCLSLKMNICEEVNVINCIYAYRVCKLLNLPDCVIKKGMESFKGVKRRFEKVECKYFSEVILDYAHHPTEIKNTLQTCQKKFKNKKVVYIFQPHTYSRTKALLKEFVNVFENVDNLILFKTFPARENLLDGVDAKVLSEKINNSIYCKNLKDLMITLFTKYKKDYVLVFIGAGDLPEILYKNNFIFNKN